MGKGFKALNHSLSKMHSKNICFISQILSVVADEKDMTYNKSCVVKSTLIMMGITTLFTSFVPLQLEWMPFLVLCGWWRWCHPQENHHHLSHSGVKRHPWVKGGSYLLRSHCPCAECCTDRRPLEGLQAGESRGPRHSSYKQVRHLKLKPLRLHRFVQEKNIKVSLAYLMSKVDPLKTGLRVSAAVDRV